MVVNREKRLSKDVLLGRKKRKDKKNKTLPSLEDEPPKSLNSVMRIRLKVWELGTHTHRHTQ